MGMNIVYCIDDNYASFAVQSIKSVIRYNPTAQITIVSQKPIDIGYNNIVIPLNGDFRKRSEKDRISKTAYLKLFLTELPYDKVLYLDADTICQAPLDELYNMDCEYICSTESHNYGIQQAKELGLNKYALTGMLLMNLKALRKIDFTKKCLEVQKKVNPNIWCHDETCINVAMHDKIKFVDKKFDYCHNRTYTDPIPEEKAVILHFLGKDKKDIFTERYKEIKPLINWLKGKTVAIVGNAKSIFDNSYGAEIDAHDAVLRFNAGYIYKEEAQGTKTNVLFCACPVDIDRFNSPRFVINRSKRTDVGRATISDAERKRLKDILGHQPSTGFMAIDICIYSEPASIDLYGFDFESTPTFYNPAGYHTMHDYSAEKDIVTRYAKNKILNINGGENV